MSAKSPQTSLANLYLYNSNRYEEELQYDYAKTKSPDATVLLDTTAYAYVVY